MSQLPYNVDLGGGVFRGGHGAKTRYSEFLIVDDYDLQLMAKAAFELQKKGWSDKAKDARWWLKWWNSQAREIRREMTRNAPRARVNKKRGMYRRVQRIGVGKNKRVVMPQGLLKQVSSVSTKAYRSGIKIKYDQAKRSGRYQRVSTPNLKQKAAGVYAHLVAAGVRFAGEGLHTRALPNEWIWDAQRKEMRRIQGKYVEALEDRLIEALETPVRKQAAPRPTPRWLKQARHLPDPF